LRLTFFIAGDAAIKPFDERTKLFGVRHGEVFTRKEASSAMAGFGEGR
jgi:hypothetical protein